LGRNEGEELVYARKLVRCFSKQDKRALLQRLTPLRPQAANGGEPQDLSERAKPVVLVDAEFRGTTGDGLLRHPALYSPCRKH